MINKEKATDTITLKEYEDLQRAAQTANTTPAMLWTYVKKLDASIREYQAFWDTAKFSDAGQLLTNPITLLPDRGPSPVLPSATQILLELKNILKSSS